MKKLVLVFASLLFFPSIGGAEKIVTVTTLTDNGPFTFDKEEGVRITPEYIPPGSDSVQLQGLSWDVLKESFHAMAWIGFATRFENRPAARMELRLEVANQR